MLSLRSQSQYQSSYKNSLKLVKRFKRDKITDRLCEGSSFEFWINNTCKDYFLWTFVLKMSSKTMLSIIIYQFSLTQRIIPRKLMSNVTICATANRDILQTHKYLSLSDNKIQSSADQASQVLIDFLLKVQPIKFKMKWDKSTFCDMLLILQIN